MPLMLFSEDFIYHGESAHSGCTFEGSACNSRFNTNGETWGVVGLTYYTDNEEQRAEKAAREKKEEDETLSTVNILQGGIENRFIPGLSETTKMQIEGSFKITGDKEL